MKLSDLSLPLLVILLSATALSCSKNKTEKPAAHYQQQYDIVFDKTTNSTQATATFLEQDYGRGDSHYGIYRLSTTEKIKLNGVEGKEAVSIQGYTWEYEGDIADVTVELIKANGQVIANTVGKHVIADIDIESVVPASISTGKDFKLNLAVSNAQSVVPYLLMRVYDSTAQGYGLVETMYPQSSEITIGKATLQNITGDFVYIELNVSQQHALPNQDGKATGALTTTTRMMKKIQLGK